MSDGRNSMTSWIRRAAARIMGGLPDVVLTRILPRGQRPRTVDDRRIVVPPSTPIRVFVGPANSAGQGWQWSRAVERNIPGVGAVAMRVESTAEFGHASDQAVPVATYRWSHAWRRAQSSAVADGFTHAIIESGRPLFSDVSDSVRSDVARVTKRGVAVALLFHGSDLRMPDRHTAREEWSPYRRGEWNLTSTLQKQAERNARLVATLALPVFVSTPDLLVDAPSALWLPVVVEPGNWATKLPFADGGVPRVGHAPSNATVKGSHLVEPVLQKLHAEGIIRYRRIERIAAERMPEAYRDVDIVLDQFRIGSYGVAACEAMAAGRVVIGHVAESVRDTVQRLTGLELPILQATPRSLESLLRSIASDPAQYRGSAQAGVDFVTAVHDGSRSAEVLRSFLTASTHR